MTIEKQYSNFIDGLQQENAVVKKENEELRWALTALLRVSKHMRGTIWDGAMNPQREKVDPAIKAAEQILAPR